MTLYIDLIYMTDLLIILSIIIREKSSEKILKSWFVYYYIIAYSFILV